MAVVLLFDPDPVAATALERLLAEETRHDVRAARSEEAALAEAQSRPIDALVAAHGTIDAINLAKTLRASDPELVAIFTVRAGDESSRLAAEAAFGPLSVLVAPYERAELLLRLNPALEQRSLRIEVAEMRSQLQHAEGALRASRHHIERTTHELAMTHSELETATERLVEAEELAAVGRVVTGIAHEISSQLALVGYAEAIKARVSDPELAQFADVIVSAQKRLAGMVDEIRDFVSGPRQIEREPADLVSSVDEALSIVRYDRDVRVRNIEFRFSSRPLVEIHRQKFSQVVINLVTNAVQATGPGDTLRVEIESDSADEQAIVRVTDRGEGMTEATLSRLGEPFFTTRSDRGSGLGVGICMRIAEEHGGSLTFASELGAGTTATLRLPIFVPQVSVG